MDYINDGITVNMLVYDLVYGAGIVTGIDSSATPIAVRFTYNNTLVRFTKLGTVPSALNPTLHYSAPVITGGDTKSVDWAAMASGTAIEVSTDDIDYVPGWFLGYYPSNAHPYLAADDVIATATDAALYEFARTI